MNEERALAEIKAALEKVVKKPVQITIGTDLIGEGLLDSLDGMIFILELENRTGRKFPEDNDLVGEGYYTVRKLVEFFGRNGASTVA